uniref:Protein krueppel n=1 Tax=Stomoxys calcitrans TaxID=35570 RepID=A0A1I8PZL2_STOCA
MPPFVDNVNNNINKKCGEIIITMKKNAKNVYSFNCWFCDTIYIQMKKFTLHLEQEHETQLIQAEYKEDTRKDETNPSVDDSLFLPEIKVEDCMVDTIKMEQEDEEQHQGSGARNAKKKGHSPPFQDPLETSDDIVEEIALPSTENTQMKHFADTSDAKDEPQISHESDKPKEDIDMQTDSEDNDNVNECSDLSADENSSACDSEYKPNDSGDEERCTKRVKTKNSKSQDSKELLTALIDAFKSKPRLWDATNPEKCSGQKQRDDLFQNIADNLNVLLKQDLTLEMVKKKIMLLCKEYERAMEKQISNEEKGKNEKPDLWYYENMEFLKPSIESKIKIKRRRYHQKVKPLSDKLINDLIDIYKNYNSLWDANHLAFTVKDKRHETLQTMADEIKTKMNLTVDIFVLEKHLNHIHKSFAKDKQKKLECEKTKQEFQASCSYYGKCDFLELHQGPFSCSTCSDIIDTYNDFQIHRSSHDGSPPFKCKECGMGFKKIGNYTIHAKRHLGVFKFFCKVCGKGYPFNAELDLHMRSHTGAQPYLCSVCGEGFRTAISYDNHIRRHEERFKYFCHICKKGFNHLTRMNDHVKAHLNVRDIICTVCGKGFTSRKYLNHHKRIHEGKNYVCNICGKGFAQDAGLRAHKKYHGTPIGISSIQKEQNKYKL